MSGHLAKEAGSEGQARRAGQSGKPSGRSDRRHILDGNFMLRRPKRLLQCRAGFRSGSVGGFAAANNSFFAF